LATPQKIVCLFFLLFGASLALAQVGTLPRVVLF